MDIVENRTKRSCM